MPQQGKFTQADLDQPAQQSGQTGQFSAADLDQQPDQRGMLSRAWDTVKADASNILEHPVQATIGAVKQVPALIQAGLPKAGTAAPVTPQEFPGVPAEQPKSGWLANAFNRASDTVSKLTTPQNPGEQAGADAATAGSVAAAVPSLTRLAGSAAEQVLPSGSKVVQSAKVLAKPAADAVSELPVVDKVVKAGKAIAKYKNVPGQLSDIWSNSQTPEALGKVATPAAQPASQTGEALGTVKSGSIAEAMKPQPAEVAPGFKRGNLQDLLNKSVDAQTPNVQPGKPIYQRTPTVKTSPAEPAMPEGHTPHQSSALRSSKYDSGANEFHARMTSGDTTYVYGDVAPEEAQAFADAESKGKAYQQIKSSHPLVAKIVNGKRLPMKAGSPQ